MTLTTGERLELVDSELEDVKHKFTEALAQLKDEPAVDESLDERLAALSARLKDLGDELRPEDYDKDQVVAIFRALFAIRDLVDHANGNPDLDTCNQLLINIERFRHVVRDALDEHVGGVSDDRGLVVKQLREWLPNTALAAIADLVGVDRRTLTRWQKQSGAPSPRLRLVAQLVAILRHNWTEAGIIAWFDRPRRDLDGRKPRSLLGDATTEEDLLMAARSGRSQYAT